MKKYAMIFAGVTASMSLVAYAAQKTWDGSYASYTIHYLMYSGSISEEQAPTRSDQRLSFAVRGQLAK